MPAPVTQQVTLGSLFIDTTAPVPLPPCRATLSARRVKVPRELQLLISDMCSRLNVDGLRGDLVINRAAKALVAYEGRDTVTQEDVGRVISACLNHRCAWASVWW